MLGSGQIHLIAVGPILRSGESVLSARELRWYEMTENSRLGRLVWDSMLTADLNLRYFNEMASRYQSWDKYSKILVAITSSAAVSGWAFWGTPGVDWIWMVASGLATVVAIVNPIMDPIGIMKAASQLVGEWASILREYDLLWSQVDTLSVQEIRGIYQSIAAKEVPLHGLGVAIPRKREIIDRCTRDICMSRGLTV